MVYRDALLSWESGHNPYGATFTTSHLAFTYPPSALIILSPLAWTGFTLTRLLLWIASIGAAIGAVALVIRASGVQLTRYRWCLAIGWSCISILVLEPVRSDIDYGQIELLLMFVVVADILLVPHRYRGILIGLRQVAVNLTPFVFIAYLLAVRDFKSASRAVASFCACTALAWAFWPAESYGYWFHDILDPGRIGSISYAGNQSWDAIVNRLSVLGSATEIVWILLSLVTVAVGGFVVWHGRKAERAAPGIFATTLMGLLVSPISWTHHWVWVLLIPPMVFIRPPSSVTPLVGRLLTCILLVTCVAPYWWFQQRSRADALDAVLPVFKAAALAVWAAAEWKAWRAAETRTGDLSPTSSEVYADISTKAGASALSPLALCNCWRPGPCEIADGWHQEVSVRPWGELAFRFVVAGGA